MIIYLDSDVIISSLLSTKGAANYLINNSTDVKKTISSLSADELEIVIEKLGISLPKLDTLIKKKLTVFKSELSFLGTHKEFQHYVRDVNDSHVIAGAVQSKSDFLITYNVKDFRKDLIKNELDIVILTPALFLQHLRNN